MPTDVKGITRAREILIVTTLAERYHHVVRQRLAPTRGGTHRVSRAVWLAHLAGRPMTAYQVHKYTGMPRTTVLRHLTQLVRLGYVIEREKRFYAPRPFMEDQKTHKTLDKLIRIIIEGADQLRTVQKGQQPT
jgi:DNA-binding transcriptional ArsR family regulator